MHIYAPLLRNLGGRGGMIDVIEVTFCTGTGKIGIVCRGTKRYRPSNPSSEVAEIIGLFHTQVSILEIRGTLLFDFVKRLTIRSISSTPMPIPSWITV